MILVDRRIGSADLVPKINAAAATMPSAALAALGSLHHGDVLFFGRGPQETSLIVGVELKTVRDLLSCITSGRYADTQLVGMKSTYDHVWLLIEGEHREDAEGFLVVPGPGGWVRVPLRSPWGAWKYDAVERWKTTIMLQAGVKITYSLSRAGSARRILGLWHWYNDGPWEAHSSLKVFDRSGEEGEVLLLQKNLPVLWAKDLPKIGWTKAPVVAKHFGTAWALAHADEGEWKQIRGIGAEIARKAVAAIRGWGGV